MEWKCKVCFCLFNNRRALENHTKIEKHRATVGKKTVCPICSSIFPSKRQLTFHRQKETQCYSPVGAPSKKDGSKTRCGIIFKTQKERNIHYRFCKDCTKIKRQNIKKRMLKHNKSEFMRKIASETAIITSSREDIKKQRAIPLKKWRDVNPGKQIEYIKMAQKAGKKSTMENWLEPILKVLGFRRNGNIKCNGIQKQIDFTNDKEIIIEIDGPWHFLPIHGETILLDTQRRDQLLNNEILKRKWILIRLSMDLFVSKSGRLRDIKVLEEIANIIEKRIPGIYKIGKMYEPTNIQENKENNLYRKETDI